MFFPFRIIILRTEPHLEFHCQDRAFFTRPYLEHKRIDVIAKYLKLSHKKNKNIERPRCARNARKKSDWLVWRPASSSCIIRPTDRFSHLLRPSTLRAMKRPCRLLTGEALSFLTQPVHNILSYLLWNYICYLMSLLHL